MKTCGLLGSFSPGIRRLPMLAPCYRKSRSHPLPATLALSHGSDMLPKDKIHAVIVSSRHLLSFSISREEFLKR